MAKFKSGKTRILVATDLAGRGIDIKFLPLVINYELPRSPKDYVHRIGRTGRAGATGEAISLDHRRGSSSLQDHSEENGQACAAKKYG